MFTIALRVEGISEKGEAFECSGHATGVNRYGAQIRLDKVVAVGRQVRVTNLDNGAVGDFRVVGMLASSSPGQVEFGAEALSDNPTFWGIEFPLRPKKPLESRGLVECRRCRAARFLPLSISEVEVLESGGLLLKPCAACQIDTSWGYAMQAAAEDFQQTRDTATTERAAGLFPAVDERGDRRAFVQRPISIRTSTGQVDKAQTESLSKTGLSCSSEKAYEVNQEITLEWANPGTGLRVQARGRILRRHSIGGSRRKIYSIRYESPITALPAARPERTLGYYAAFTFLVAAAAALLGTSVLGLASNLYAPAGSLRRVASFAGVLLLVCLASLVWRFILAREPEARQTFQRKHRIATGMAAVLLVGALAAGATMGLERNHERVHVQTLLRDLVLAGALESNIDAAENRVLASPGDYVDACATLQLLAGRWGGQLNDLSTDAGALSRRAPWRSSERLRTALGRLQDVLGIDRRKLELIQKQAGLASQARNLAPDGQAAFWQANFQPLREQIIDLNARKRRLIRPQAAEY
jgi:hypothetical protein